jgi:hypothetical protein
MYECVMTGTDVTKRIYLFIYFIFIYECVVTGTYVTKRIYLFFYSQR